MRSKIFSGRLCLFVRKDQNILISKEWNGCPQAIFSEKQNQVTYNIIKKICSTPENSSNLLINIHKQLLHTKNSNCYSCKYEKNTFCSIVGGWYKELKVKNFSTTKLKYTCLKCLFLWPRWLSLCRSVCLIIIEK